MKKNEEFFNSTGWILGAIMRKYLMNMNVL